jgi:hypothetical protein
VPQPELDDALDAADKFVSVEAAIARRLSGQKLSQLTAAARELGAPAAAVCRGAWARVTVDQIRHWALQTF